MNRHNYDSYHDYRPSAFSSHNSNSSYDYPLRPRSPPPPRRQRPRTHAWPPSPSVEDEPPERSSTDDQPPADTRGAVDQDAILEDIVPDDPPVFTQRVSTPYAYTKPQQPFTPATKPTEHVFDDSDLDAPDTSHLRASERRPARYSFVKSDLHKEDIRTNLYDARPQPDTTSFTQTPTSSSSSLHSNARQPKLTPSENARHGSSGPTSRPASPTPSSTFERPSPDSRPTSANNTRPASPVMLQSPVPLTDAGRQFTYPPLTVADRSRPPSRIGRHETLPTPAPRIDVQSPSPARRAAPSVLPYPVDDRPSDVFMPAEEYYQFDHSSASSPRQTYPESTRVPSVPVPSSPRLRDGTAGSEQTRSPVIDRPARVGDSRPGSSHSRPGRDMPRERVSNAKSDLEKPLPSCPRSNPSSRYDDWYSLKGYRYFDICPHCYQGVFATTPFASNFSQTRLGEKPTERVCDFSSPWIRLAWLLTIKQRLPSLEMIYALADISEIDRPCPDDRELSSDRITWYGLADPRNNIHVANFAICSSDKRMIEALLPTMRGYFTVLSKGYSSNAPEKFMCSLRTSSRRFPKYLDLLVQLDVEAQDLGQRPNMQRFIQMARENAFKGECAKSKSFFHKAWHFMPSLPELTICEECYEEVVWPAMQSRSASSTIPRLVNKTIQLVPDENSDSGTSCMLYSPRMRKVWDVSVREEDFVYLKRKVLERKKAENRIAKERKSIVNWMMGLERGGLQWDRAKSELRDLEQEWAMWE